MKRYVFLLLFAMLLAGGSAQAQSKHPPTEKTDSRVKDRGGKRDRHRKARWISLNQRKHKRKVQARKLKGLY